MTDHANLCVRCSRPTPDGYADVHCRDRAAGQLASIIDLTPSARSVAYGLARRGEGASSGKPGSRSPGNDDAMDALDEIQNLLTTLARDIAEMRGAQFTSAAFEGHRVADPLIEASSWLGGQLEWVRHAVDGTEPYAIRAFSEIAECAARMRSIVDGPRAKKYLGPCGAETAWAPGTMIATEICEGDVYGVPGNSTGTCRTCGAKVDQAERTAWLDSEVRAYAYTAAEIADAYPSIKANTIRQWLSRGLLVAHGELEGRPLLLLGDVLDLAAGDAARREEARARRAARREEASAA